MLICLLVISLKITSIKKSNNSWAILKNMVLKSKPTRSSGNYIADSITCTENLIFLTSCSNLFCESILRSEYYLISELHMFCFIHNFVSSFLFLSENLTPFKPTNKIS